MEKPWHYHTMRDGEGKLIWEGQYDLYPLWNCFGIPEDLRGQSVIDIGTATGFFAYECEKRGAGPVVATELADIANWDARSGCDYHGVDIPRSNQEDFKQLHELFRSRVRVHWGTINEPLHNTLGQFDWVIFGSLMTHIRDPLRALENVRLLTRGRAIIISSCRITSEEAALYWIESDRPYDWWIPSKALIPRMLRAVGFRRVECVGDFRLVHREGHQQPQSCWHAYPV